MQSFANIIYLSTVYMSFAVGMALVFGVMRIINFAYGELFMLGGYSLWVVVALLHGTAPAPVLLIVALVVAGLFVGMIGVAIHFGIAVPMRDRPFSIFMATLGVSYILQVAVVQTLGPIGTSLPTLFPGIVRPFGVIFPTQRIIICAITFTIIACLWFFLTRTRTGRVVRAAGQNPIGATLQGVSLTWIGAITMFIGAALAGLSGVLIGSVSGLNPFMGSDAIWRAFIIIIVGGIGSIPGAVAAAILFGTLDTLLTAFGYGHLVAMTDAIIMLLILSFMPSGIMGAKE